MTTPSCSLIIRASIGMACMTVITSCSTTSPTEKVMVSSEPYLVSSVQHGEASWYSVHTNRGTHTASGERLVNSSATAAHRTLPFGTKVRVTNELNGESQIVTINNRGPHIRGRIIDVTVGTAAKLGFQKRGVAPVKVEVLKRVSDARS